MRKSLIALCVAAALTIPMIVQADANLLMAQPALFFQYEVGQAQPVTLTAEVPKAIDNRLPMPQLEAVVIMAVKSKQRHDSPHFGKLIDKHGVQAGLFEVGWRI